MGQETVCQQKTGIKMQRKYLSNDLWQRKCIQHVYYRLQGSTRRILMRIAECKQSCWVQDSIILHVAATWQQWNIICGTSTRGNHRSAVTQHTGTQQPSPGVVGNLAENLDIILQKVPSFFLRGGKRVVGNDFQWSSETVIPLCVSVLGVGRAPGKSTRCTLLH